MLMMNTGNETVQNGWKMDASCAIAKEWRNQFVRALRYLLPLVLMLEISRNQQQLTKNHQNFRVVLRIVYLNQGVTRVSLKDVPTQSSQRVQEPKVGGRPLTAHCTP